MNLNITSAPDFSAISQEELQQEYTTLLTKYLDIKLLNDKYNQEIYALKRSLQTATAAESYLSQELEMVISSHTSEIEKLQHKHNQEIDDIKVKNANFVSLTQTLEQNVEDLKNENILLKQKIENSEALKPLQPSVTIQNFEREIQLETENLELLAKIDQFQLNANQTTISMAEKQRQIETLQEQVQCLEENLQSKRHELEEKTNLLECTQERMTEMNAELAVLKSQPENENRKGNSLFAEVDDQRQAMKKLLAAQKKNYLHMKKVYNESEHEIRRLKRENAAMHKELQACTSIFLNAEKMYKDKLNERISQLLKQNKELEKRLTWTEEKLIEISNNKGINWLDSMLTYCRNETRELKAQLHSCRMQKGTLESNLRNSQQELAKWRFEALRSRCIIINRENLLEENGIKFQSFVPRDFPISEKECEEATPRIILEPKIKSTEKIVHSPTNGNNDVISDGVLNKTEHASTTEKTNEIIEQTEKITMCDSSQVNEIQSEHKIQENSLNYNDKCTQFSKNLKKESEIEVTETCYGNNFKNKIKDDCSFLIYEDTTQYMPIVQSSSATQKTFEIKQHFDISISEDTFRQLTEIGHKNCASTSSQNDSENRIETKESILPPDMNFFQIYEDTTQNLPVRMPPWAERQSFVENAVKKQENKENLNSCNQAIKNEERGPSMDKICLKSSSDTKNESILIKSRGSTSSQYDSENSTETKESILPSNTNLFQIYEDTMQNLPVRIPPWTEHQSFVESDVKKKENEEILNSCNQSNKNKERSPSVDKICLKSSSVTKNPSILISSRSIFSDEADSKSVRFHSSVNNQSVADNKGNIKGYGKQTRTKPNVIIKRVMIQSKAEKK